MTSFSSADDVKESIHDYTVKDIKGKEVDLSEYKGKVLLIVNVASKCGATPQYAPLQMLDLKYGKEGFSVIGFPANNYGGQEPGTDDEIAEFCSDNYDVTFPMMSKVSVKGDDQAPLFQYLTTANNPDKEGDIGWNFEKFLVGKDGKVLRRFTTQVQPDDSAVTEAIEAAIKG
ncbi:glutathione peroxidase [Verrucomicrobiales bacterium]|nr:glutathione peroxidase [Verrucomicrobiales bacterium]